MATITDTHLTKVLEQFEKHLSLKFHPVGSYYMTEGSENPGTLFGGIWVKILDRVLIGAGSAYAVGAEGGEATHTLTEDEVPSHTHTRGTMNITGAIPVGEAASVKDWDNYVTGAFYRDTSTSDQKGAGGGFDSDNQLVRMDASRTWEGETSSFGGGQPHNILPPYRACNIWRRTA